MDSLTLNSGRTDQSTSSSRNVAFSKIEGCSAEDFNHFVFVPILHRVASHIDTCINTLN